MTRTGTGTSDRTFREEKYRLDLDDEAKLPGEHRGRLERPVDVIFDTDIAPDVDDVGALAVLHALADAGEATVLATISCNPEPSTVRVLDVINTYYGRPDVPVGIAGEDAPRKGSDYHDYLVENFPHDVRSPSDAESAVDLYRRVLSAAPDHSVVVVGVGWKTNLQNLLQSEPDSHSPLDGEALVARKVALLSDMGGEVPPGEYNPEGNFRNDPEAAAFVAERWPTPVVYSPHVVGAQVRTGSGLEDTASDNPVRHAYRIYLGGEGKARNSYDLTSVLYAVRGARNYWGVENEGHVFVRRSDGWTEWRDAPDSNHAYLTEEMPVPELTDVLDGLLERPPA